jgi:hypothetical protein
LLEFPDTVQYELLKNIIINNTRSTAYDVYTRFKVLITYDVLQNTSGIDKVLDLETIASNDPDQPIGYITNVSAKIYTKGSFIDVPSTYFTTIRAENDILVGFTNTMKGKTEFLIRPPIKKYDDKRLIPRGAVCNTRLKTEIKKHIDKLKDHCSKCKPWVKKDFQLDKFRTSELCKKLKLILLSLEEEARTKGSKTVWLYLFNET